MKYLFTLSYLGTAYCGWQVQPNGPTVQAAVQRAAEQIFRSDCAVTGCSRTDSGVHANQFCCTIAPKEQSVHIPTDRLPVVFNLVLPEDISVLRVRTVSETFHPRYSVISKEYEYLILNSEIRNPFWNGRAWRYPHPLDENLLQKAAQYFIGTHDFAGFMSATSNVENTVRTIYRFDVFREDDLIRIRVTGNGFLYHMVRILCGTLIAVAERKFNSDDLAEILESKDRTRAGPTLPSCGLYLNQVNY